MSDQRDPRVLRSPARLAVFRAYLHTLFWRRFNAVRVARGSWRSGEAEGRPLVVYTNHPSWWDPALLLLVSEKLFPGRHCYGPIAAPELERYALFRRFGLFGIEPDSLRGAARFLQVATDILAEPRALLCVTAEGAFADVRRRPLALRPGIAHLARRVPEALFVPMALEYTFWNESRPEALLHVGRPLSLGACDAAEAAPRLEAALARTMDELAAVAVARSPAAFHPLLEGRAGLGGTYDAWRRLRAAAHGARFDPRHETGD